MFPSQINNSIPQDPSSCQVDSARATLESDPGVEGTRGAGESLVGSAGPPAFLGSAFNNKLTPQGLPELAEKALDQASIPALDRISDPLILTNKEHVSRLFIINKLQRKREACGKAWTVHTHQNCGAKVGVPVKCDLKWCPGCFFDWVMVEKARILKKIKKDAQGEGVKWPLHIVLTIRNQKDLADMRRKMIRYFRKLRQTKFWKEAVRAGGIVSQGLTRGEDGWHYHFHIVVDCRWLEASALTKEWIRITGGEGNDTRVERVKSRCGIATELVKGTQGDMKKLRELEKASPELFYEVVITLEGKKFFWTFGRFRLDRKQKPALLCPRCGERYRWWEWDRETMTREEFFRYKHGPFWGDFYENFLYVEDQARSP